MNENNDIDSSIVDWAYGEMDKVRSDAFEARLEKDPDLKAEAESMKKVLGSYTQSTIDVDPPRSLRESLLLEAAKEAKQNKQNGFLSWFSSSVLGSPGAMAMASLAVVVGFAGIMYKKGSMKFADMSQQEARMVEDSSLAADRALSKAAVAVEEAESIQEEVSFTESDFAKDAVKKVAVVGGINDPVKKIEIKRESLDVGLMQEAEKTLKSAKGSKRGSYGVAEKKKVCLLYTSPSPRDATLSRMPSSA